MKVLTSPLTAYRLLDSDLWAAFTAGHKRLASGDRGHPVAVPCASMHIMDFELWEGSDPDLGGEEWTLLGPDHVKSREMLEPWMQLTWTVEAETHDEAMQLVYDQKGLGHYLTWDERAAIGTFVEVKGVTPNPESE